MIGAGWIGAEVAASARQRGVEVTVVDPTSVPLERVLGPEVGAVYRDIHRDHGVELLLGTGARGASRASGCVERVAHRRRAHDRVRLRRRRRRRRAAHRAGRARPASRSTTASSSTRRSRPAPPASSPPATSPTPGIPFYERAHPRRALGQRAQPGPGGGAQRCSARPRAYDRLPYFFSDQYDVGMEYAGYATELGRGRLPRRPRRARVHRLLAARATASSPA